jgi:hypothetical protein
MSKGVARRPDLCLSIPLCLIDAEWMTTCAVPAIATCQLFDTGFAACAGDAG